MSPSTRRAADGPAALGPAAKASYELRLDLAGVDLGALQTDEDFRSEARRLLPTALDDLGQAMGEAAWHRHRAGTPGPAVKVRGASAARAKFIAEAGRKYMRHAPAKERQALEELIVRRLREARDQGAAGTQDGGSTVPPP